MKILTKEEILPSLISDISKAKQKVQIISPWIKSEVLEKILSSIDENIKLEVIIRSSELSDFLITDEKVFQLIKERNGTIFLNPQIHAKVVIIDSEIAYVSSANITNAGLIDEDGNIEAGTVINNKKEIKKLENYFEEIKNLSISIDDISGFILNSTNGRNGEALLLQELNEQTYLKFPNEKGFILGRILEIRKLNTSLFSSDENFIFKNLFSNKDELQKVILGKENDLWKKSAFYSLLNENNPSISIAKIELITEYNPQPEEGKSFLKTPLNPIPAGTIFSCFTNDEEIEKILKINHAGYYMDTPVKFGKLLNTDLNCYLDLEKIATMHMAVLGTTGSGKTTFVRRVLENIPETDIQVFIIDLYDEYSELDVPSKKIKKISLKDILFPLTAEDMKKLFKEEGIVIQEKTNEEKNLVAFLKQKLKPDLEFTAFNNESLEDILFESLDVLSPESHLRNEIIGFMDIIKRNYGEDALTYQKETVSFVKEGINAEKQFIIFNFKEINNINSRINIAGIIMKELFLTAKKNPDKKRIIVLEEAQNFAPEKGFGEVQASSDNISFIMSRKIATEGRKFNLGITAITQRPANISKYVLSQLNTQVIFKLINNNDLEAVSVFFESSKAYVFDLLPFFKPGVCYITGLAVPFGLISEIKLG